MSTTLRCKDIVIRKSEFFFQKLKSFVSFGSVNVKHFSLGFSYIYDNYSFTAFPFFTKKFLTHICLLLSKTFHFTKPLKIASDYFAIPINFFQ